jgi:hypothetical protein
VVFLVIFFYVVIFLTNKIKGSNELIVHKLRVFNRKWLNLLTKWYIVVKCGNIFYIFAQHLLRLLFGYNCRDI